MAQMCEFAMNLSNKEFAKVFSYQHFGGCVNLPNIIHQIEAGIDSPKFSPANIFRCTVKTLYHIITI